MLSIQVRSPLIMRGNICHSVYSKNQYTCIAHQIGLYLNGDAMFPLTLFEDNPLYLRNRTTDSRPATAARP